MYYRELGEPNLSRVIKTTIVAMAILIFAIMLAIGAFIYVMFIVV